MHGRHWFGVAALLAGFAQTQIAWANVVVPPSLSPAIYFVAVGDAYSNPQSSTTYISQSDTEGSASYLETGQIIGGGTGLSASAAITVGPPTYSAGGPSYAEALEGYEFAIVGPSGNVPVEISGSGSVQIFGDAVYSGGGANLDIVVVNQYAVADGCAGGDDLCFGSPFQTAFNISGTYELPANQAIAVDMEALAFYGGGTGGGLTAMVDPTFSIDPSFANAGAYSIIYSPGYAPTPATGVPEPAALAVFCVGIGALGAVRRRKVASVA